MHVACVCSGALSLDIWCVPIILCATSHHSKLVFISIIYGSQHRSSMDTAVHANQLLLLVHGVSSCCEHKSTGAMASAACREVNYDATSRTRASHVEYSRPYCPILKPRTTSCARWQKSMALEDEHSYC